MRWLPALMIPALVLAACSASTDSSLGSVPVDGTVPGVAATTDIASSPTTPADDVAASTTTDQASTTSVVEPPPASPTAGVAVVHVGTQTPGSWTPLAIWDGSAWSTAGFDDVGEEIPIPASSFDSVVVASVGLAEPLTGLVYGPSDFICVDDRQGPTLDPGAAFVAAPEGSFGYGAVSLAADWDVQPRPVSYVGADAEVYQETGEAIAVAAGVDPTGGDVTQVIRADLNGNGIEEVLVSFQKITDDFGAAGDFSIIYARYPAADGTVVDDVIFEYYPESSEDFPTIGRAGVLAVGDFNGDAVMEVAVRSEFWESAIAELYVYDGVRLTSVAVSGCSV